MSLPWPSKCQSCGVARRSVFVGGSVFELTDVDIAEWIKKNITKDFIHVVKMKGKTFGHVHFSTDEDTSTFFFKVFGKDFRGPNGCKLTFKAATEFGSRKAIDYRLPVIEITNEVGPLTDEPQVALEKVESVSTGKNKLDIVPREFVRQLPNQSTILPSEFIRELPSQYIVRQLLSQSTDRLPFQDVENQRPNQGEEISRKRKSSGVLVDNQLALFKEEAAYRVYESRTSYTVIVHTPSAKISDLVLRCADDGSVTVECRFPPDETDGVIIEDHIPEKCAMKIKLPKRIDSGTVNIMLEGGITKLTVKKFEYKGKEREESE